METNESTSEVPCNNCGISVSEKNTKLVLAQGLMMPVVPKYQGCDGRFGFSILLRVCNSCHKCLVSSDSRKHFKRPPTSENFSLTDLDTFYAFKDEQKGYYIRRKYLNDSWRGHTWSPPEWISICEENKHV